MRKDGCEHPTSSACQALVQPKARASPTTLKPLDQVGAEKVGTDNSMDGLAKIQFVTESIDGSLPFPLPLIIVGEDVINKAEWCHSTASSVPRSNVRLTFGGANVLLFCGVSMHGAAMPAYTTRASPQEDGRFRAAMQAFALEIKVTFLETRSIA